MLAIECIRMNYTLCEALSALVPSSIHSFGSSCVYSYVIPDSVPVIRMLDHINNYLEADHDIKTVKKQCSTRSHLNVGRFVN